MDDQEEKEGNGLIANVVQMIILFWSLGVISWSYFNPNPTRQIDTTFAAGLLSAVSAQFGLNVKKGNVMKTLRAAFFGTLKGPDLIQSWILLSRFGKDRSRISRFI